jgi:hypothetical protein
MTTVNIGLQNDTTAVSGWNVLSGATSTGQKIANLLDDAGASTGLSFWVTTAFYNQLGSSNLATGAAHGVPEKIWENFWYSNGSGEVEIRGFNAGQTGTIEMAGDAGKDSRDSNYSINGGSNTLYDANGGEPFTAPVTVAFTADSSGVVSITGSLVSSFWYLNFAIVTYSVASGPDYTARKGATGVEITHTLTADGITSQTLDGEAVTRASQSGQVVTLDFDESAILTSGEINLVLGDGVDTETFTVQYNVIGLPSNTLLKDGAALASLTDVKLTVLDASGTRLDRQTGLTTDADGLTGVTPVAAGAVDDLVEVSFFSPGSEVGIVYETTLGLL